MIIARRLRRSFNRQSLIAIVPKEQGMSIGVENRIEGPPSIEATEAGPAFAALVVRLHCGARGCTASFRGSPTVKTRMTIDGLADLLAGEETVVLDLSRIDVVDKYGADALGALIDTVRKLGALVLMVPPHPGADERKLL